MYQNAATKARRCGARSVFIGPEGDFTPEELKALLEIAIPTSFGPTILRAETAAIFAVSVLAGAMHSNFAQTKER